MFGCTLIIISYLAVSTVIAVVDLGIRTSASALIRHMIRSVFGGLPFYFAMAMVFFFFVIVTRKGALSIAGSVAFSIIFVVFTNKAYSARTFPEQSWLRLIPAVQLSGLYDGSLILEDYLLTFTLSVISICAIFLVCATVIRRVELGRT